LLVEAFMHTAEDAVDEVGGRDVIVLSKPARPMLDPARDLLGQPATLETSLADGSRTSFAGDISEAAMLGSDGGFARYRLRISPWLWRLGRCATAACGKTSPSSRSSTPCSSLPAAGEVALER
jgi:type VI secretion system secreted protein VgrG